MRFRTLFIRIPYKWCLSVDYEANYTDKPGDFTNCDDIFAEQVYGASPPRWSSESTTPAFRFRALLTKGGIEHVQLVRGRVGERIRASRA
jgi:hypothetical protein